MDSECQICGRSIGLGMVVCPICSADERAAQVKDFVKEFNDEDEAEPDDPGFDPDIEEAFCIGEDTFEF